MSVSFKVEEFKDAKKDFRGIIVNAEYGEEPLGMKGRADIMARDQLAIEIESEEYDKHQFEWYPPSDKKLTKARWFSLWASKVGEAYKFASSIVKLVVGRGYQLDNPPFPFPPSREMVVFLERSGEVRCFEGHKGGRKDGYREVGVYGEVIDRHGVSLCGAD